MSNILFAWELGSNLGHIARDLPVGLALRARGHQVYFASRNLQQAQAILMPEGFACFQAPRLLQQRQPIIPSTYAEILLANGYNETGSLNALVAAWQRMARDLKADVVVCNHAPTAVLAMRCADIPTVATSIGFEMPPASPQVFRTWDPPPEGRAAAAEQCAIQMISQTLDQCGRGPVESVAELFSSASVLMTTFPELDHYGSRRGLNYIGPIGRLPGRRPEWSTGVRKRVFAYLRNTVPNVSAILAGLAASPFEVFCVMPDLAPADITELQGENLLLQRETVDIFSVLALCDLVVTYGTGTVHDALLAGRPLLLCPQNAEQYLMGLRVVRLGAGLMLPVDASPTAISETVSILLSERSFSDAAWAFSEKYATYSMEAPLQKAIVEIESRL
ncbi:UDP-glucuronosyltransferase [Rhizobium leguminosarum]|uniref:glycosyltransferase n=1 Tax=Rhizobium leguminosarum TaxID=384 RepID=UPI0010321190|nr:nucleotide disphospho-sugar-binding domain-containing protein [Rhizobium leguminosarum]TAZ45257.1 UDP-glucuronosyltransferase [Rhizobium leguminosarum]